MTSEAGGLTGPIDVIRKTVARKGVMGMWRGYMPTCGMRLWGLPFYFGGNETAKKMLGADRPLTKTDLMLSGGLGGIAFWLACYPLDTMKTVVQSQSGAATGLREATMYIWNKHGVRGFYRGIVPCLIRSFPANAVVFVTVDMVQNAMMRKQ